MDDTDHDDVDLYICMCRHFIRQTFQYNEHFCLTFQYALLQTGTDFSYTLVEGTWRPGRPPHPHDSMGPGFKSLCCR